jgi:U3 small nucleolar ribonucleoprotein protein IMP4
MLRKNLRLKKEFLFKREQEKKAEKKVSEAKDKALTDAKKKLKTTPSLLKKRKDDEFTQEEYEDPELLVTTCRNPSSRLQKFFKEIGLMFPNATRMNRGAYKLKDIVDMCNRKKFSDLIILHEHQGEPDGMIISHLPHGPTLHLGIGNTVLRHDVESKAGNISQANPHLIFHNFGGVIGERLKRIFQHLFPIPKEESKRVMSFICNEVSSQ